MLPTNTVFNVSIGPYFLIFVIRENELFLSVNRDPLYFSFVNRAGDFPVRPS